MPFFRNTQLESEANGSMQPHAMSLSGRLMLWLIPPVVAILLVTGYITHRVSARFVQVALERNTMLQARILANESTQLFESCKQSLRFLANQVIDTGKLHDYLANNRASGGIPFRELAFISQNNTPHLFLVTKGAQIYQIPSESIASIQPNPLVFLNDMQGMGADEVAVTPIIAVEHPFPSTTNLNRRIASQVIRFITRCSDQQNGAAGFLMLSIDARELRNLLSLYASPKSPVWDRTRSPEPRYSFLFDTHGWILLQSEDPAAVTRELETDQVRSRYTGTLGRPDLPSAFRPKASFSDYWRMVDDIANKRAGLIVGKDPDSVSADLPMYTMAYAPILFSGKPDAPPSVYGGVTFIDRNRLPITAGYRHIDVILFITLVTLALVTLLIVFIGRHLTHPILSLARAVTEFRDTGQTEALSQPLSGFEITTLQEAIKAMLTTMNHQLDEIRMRDRTIASVSRQAPAALDAPKAVPGKISGIIGHGTKLDKLRSDIGKAAQVDVDVLIMGETGTGKQVTAEAIHRLCHRSSKPFISINCGELDESLLLDTLFGHTKGAFTEAKTDRKGAFVEANGGTLFLDEIQTASAKVQQALLRAIAMRKIKPLGSDREIDVDVRVIAATNVDLAPMIEQGLFRRDLYFRLKVITIVTPALRTIRENVPVLIGHYLEQASIRANKSGLAVSRGALEKMSAYDWPGNVRELINCVTRAVVMAEGQVIQAADVDLESGDTGPDQLLASSTDQFPGVSASENVPPDMGLNRRQKSVWPHLIQKGSLTRSEYQKLAGEPISPRTAINDLKDLAKKGLVIQVGKGPATRYVADILKIGN
jgi:two-component system response regulator HydG